MSYSPPKKFAYQYFIILSMKFIFQNLRILDEALSEFPVILWENERQLLEAFVIGDEHEFLFESVWFPHVLGVGLSLLYLGLRFEPFDFLML